MVGNASEVNTTTPIKQHEIIKNMVTALWVGLVRFSPAVDQWTMIHMLTPILWAHGAKIGCSRG